MLQGICTIKPLIMNNVCFAKFYNFFTCSSSIWNIPRKKPRKNLPKSSSFDITWLLFHLFLKAQSCAHYHLGWRSQKRSYQPQCWMLRILQVHSLHLFFVHHFSSNLVHNPNNIHQFQPFKTCLTSIQSSSYHFVVCIW